MSNSNRPPYALSRRERKKQKTKESILKSARSFFENQGFEQTTISEIADKCDVSKATVFNYFPSKDRLLAGIGEDEVDDILFLGRQELDDSLDSRDRIMIIMKRLLDDSIPFLHLTGMVMFSSIINSESRPSSFNAIHVLLKEFVQQGQERNEIKQADPDLIATTILGAYFGVLFKWFYTTGNPGRWEELESLLQAVLLPYFD